MAEEVAVLKEEHAMVDDGHFRKSVQIQTICPLKGKKKTLTESPRVVVLARPYGDNIAPHPPALAGLTAPLLDVRVSPIAQRVEDSPRLPHQRVSHVIIPRRRVRPRPVVPHRRRRSTDLVFVRSVPVLGPVLVLVGPIGRDIAVIILQVYSSPRISTPLIPTGLSIRLTIHAPVAERLRVNILVPKRRGIPGARLCPCVRVDPQLQAQRVHFLRGPADAVGELIRVVADAVRFSVAAVERPAVVDIDILVARVFQSQIHNLLRCGLCSGRAGRGQRDIPWRGSEVGGGNRFLVFLTRNLSSWISHRNAFHELNPSAGSFPVFPSLGLRPLTVAVKTFTASASRETELTPIVERIVRD